MTRVIGEISKKNDETNKLLSEFKKIEETPGYAELVCRKIDGAKYNFNIFALPLKFIEKIHNYEITLDEAMDDQKKLEKLIIRLENYNAKNKNKIDEKNKVLKSAVELFHATENIVDFFEKGVFPFKGNVFKTEEKSEEKSKEDSEDESEKERVKKFFKHIENESKVIDYDLFKNYFTVLVPSALAKKIYKTKNKNKNNELVELIKSRWSDLKDKIK